MNKILVLAPLLTASICGAQNVAQCQKVLEVGRLTSTYEGSLSSVSHAYAALCRDTSLNTTNSQSNDGSVGVDLFDVMGADLGYGSDSVNKSEYRNKVCQEMRSGSAMHTTLRTRIESFDKSLVAAYQSCISQPGLHVWTEFNPDDTRTVDMKFMFVPSGAQATPKFTREVQWLPKNAIKSCSGTPPMVPMSAHTVTCTVNPAFKGRVVKLSQATDLFSERTANVVLPRPFVPSSIKVVPAHDYPLLHLTRAPSSDVNIPAPPNAPLGQWLDIDFTGYPVKVGNSTRHHNPSFGITMVDPLHKSRLGEHIQVGFVRQYRDHQKGIHHPYEPKPRLSRVPVVIGKEQSHTPLEIDSFNHYWSDNKSEVLTVRAEMKIDAGPHSVFGVEARFKDQPKCALADRTSRSLPGGAPDAVWLDIQPSFDGLAKCVVQVRLCASEKSREYANAVTRCGS